jgi:hypothetical protein
MSVIVHLQVPTDAFELGRMLETRGGPSLELESLVPFGPRTVPFFSVQEPHESDFEERVRNHPLVGNLRVVSRYDGRTMYAFDWESSRDPFFQGLLDLDAQVLTAKGGSSSWEFGLRFPDHDALGEFRRYCSDAHIRLDVGRIYHPTRPGTGPWYGLTTIQRETLARAVEGGYYAIPRELSTKELAETFEISDQAVTERLRRAIVRLAENTLSVAEEDSGGDQ